MSEPTPPSEQPPQRARPEPIKAVPVRHPGRWISVAVIILLAAMFVHMLITNDNFQWSFMMNEMFRPPIIQGLVRGTILLTVLGMLIGVSLGIVIAVMRLSPNPVLKGSAWLFTWFFRAVPRLVLLVMFGNLGVLYEVYGFGIPFDQQIADLFGFNLDGRFFEIEARTILTAFTASLLGLALSEAAYMSEIVRSGILSVNPGQTEAAQALGMSQIQIMRRIVLPQAMRVIIPPTGNETIALLKDTALVAVVPLQMELFFQLDAIGKRTFTPFPMYVAACLWYLALTSILMVGQYFLERHYGRGVAGGRQGQGRLAALRGGGETGGGYAGGGDGGESA